MSSKIQWTDETWNPVTGCTKVSAGCKNCYAETVAKRFWGNRKFTDVQLHPDRLEQPLHWKKPRMIFVNSMSDLFHEDIPFDFIDKIFAIMWQTPQHTYQILTKRPARMLEYMTESGEMLHKIVKNVWLGVSVEDQATADERREHLKQISAVVRFVSYEPALENIKWEGWEFADWLIAGGESGQKKRPCNTQWFRNARDWATINNVKFFMKQIDKIKSIPDDLMIREYPDNRIKTELRKK